MSFLRVLRSVTDALRQTDTQTLTQTDTQTLTQTDLEAALSCHFYRAAWNADAV